MNEQLTDDLEMVREVLVRGHIKSDGELWDAIWPVVLHNPTVLVFFLLFLFILTIVLVLLVRPDAFRGFRTCKWFEEIPLVARGL